MNDVAIIGVGLHPFARFEGKAAMAMADDAIQLALGGMVGLTGIPFTYVFNACATAAAPPNLARTRFGWATITLASPSAWTSTRAAPSPKILR
jgi:acetyl-CoA acetyltransferase